MRHTPIAAGCAAAMAAMLALSGCAPAPQASTKSLVRPVPPVITKTVARHLLASFTATSNRSNRRRDTRLLARYETGASYLLSASGYAYSRFTNPANRGFARFSFAAPAFFIPRQAGYPRWFAVQADQRVAGHRPQPGGIYYLLFTQARAGARWMLASEPYSAGWGAPAPSPATDSQGYATEIDPADAAGLAAAPGAVPSLHRGYLDGTAGAVRFGNGMLGLADVQDLAFWRTRLPAGSVVSDSHATTRGRVFALRTTDGGALVFYDLTATLTLAPPKGTTFRIRIPGIFPGRHRLTSARIRYDEQFASYDPPKGRTGMRVVAEVS